ncbi:isoflavone 7-O-methyltransferase-like protein [Trifolium pratense]|uniref:Isoflavone 7-O-methyltransferase-like protein n=1 Tax=Trifolium pratense TaxID=57577 RepID=A0A2K3LMC0_TRIPR|nr:isoflavone 7-O-methyltransferase-like protein [Trifolium pratense]
MDHSSNGIGNDESELYHAQLHLYKHIYSFISSMALKSAVELGIADVIHNHGKPMTLTELASSLKLHPSKINVLYRFMRLLTHNGLFAKTTAIKKKTGGDQEEEEETTYALTPPSKLLVRGASTCLASLAGGHPSCMNMWHSSKKWLTEDKEFSLFESANGDNFWNMLNKDPESHKLMSLFQEAMDADSQMFKLALKDCKHVFEGLESLVDVGGGTGVVAKLIHEVFPDIKYTVLDQPQVVGNLTGNKYLNFVGGDMFKSIPQADAVLLKVYDLI